MAPLEGLMADPYINAVHFGIKRGIDVAIENQCWRAAMLLIYAGMDAMAFTTVEPPREDVTRADFIAWAGRYVRFDGAEQLTGADLYGARCAVLHTYGSESRMSRSGSCRLVHHCVHGVGGFVKVVPQYPDSALVSIFGLRAAFYRAIDSYMADLEGDAAKSAKALARLGQFMHEIPVD